MIYTASTLSMSCLILHVFFHVAQLSDPPYGHDFSPCMLLHEMLLTKMIKLRKLNEINAKTVRLRTLFNFTSENVPGHNVKIRETKL